MKTIFDILETGFMALFVSILFLSLWLIISLIPLMILVGIMVVLGIDVNATIPKIICITLSAVIGLLTTLATIRVGSSLSDVL